MFHAQGTLGNLKWSSKLQVIHSWKKTDSHVQFCSKKSHWKHLKRKHNHRMGSSLQLTIFCNIWYDKKYVKKCFYRLNRHRGDYNLGAIPLSTIWIYTKKKNAFPTYMYVGLRMVCVGRWMPEHPKGTEFEHTPAYWQTIAGMQGQNVFSQTAWKKNIGWMIISILKKGEIYWQMTVKWKFDTGSMNTPDLTDVYVLK